MLRVSALAAAYQGTRVVHNVDLHCEAGEIVCLLGRNGAGKSTTAKAVMGLMADATGAIEFEGQSLGRHKPHDIARLGIGYVPEQRLVFPDLTVTENLAMGHWRGLRQPAANAFAPVYELFPRLADKRTQYGRTLSGGEQQMLAIGRALMGRPRLLLVDEPTEGLAPVIVQALQKALRALADDGLAVVVAESKLAAARRIAHRVTVIAKGRSVFDGPPAALEADIETRRRYLEV